MDRPVRPVALVILTACMLYPGLTMAYQGGYPFVTGEWFSLLGNQGPWMAMFAKMTNGPILVSVAKTVIGLMWIGGVLGLWAGDMKAYPLALAAAVLTLLYPGGGMIMAVLALISLLAFREKATEVTA
jgi:hypothetical protein